MWFLKYSFDKKDEAKEPENTKKIKIKIAKKNKNNEVVRKTIKKRQQRGTRTKFGDFFTRAFRPLKNQ
jgi:hypothetical protein